MKFFEKNNLLDEMQEKKQLKIESRGFWLLWAALFAAMMIQQAVDVPLEVLWPEYLVFFGASAYTAISSLRAGIWDRHIVPTAAGNVVFSLAGGAFIMLYFALRLVYRYEAPLWVGLCAGAIGGLFTAALIFILMQISLSIYRKRRKQLETEDETD